MGTYSNVLEEVCEKKSHGVYGCDVTPKHGYLSYGQLKKPFIVFLAFKRPPALNFLRTLLPFAILFIQFSLINLLVSLLIIIILNFFGDDTRLIAGIFLMLLNTCYILWCHHFAVEFPWASS